MNPVNSPQLATGVESPSRRAFFGLNQDLNAALSSQGKAAASAFALNLAAAGAAAAASVAPGDPYKALVCLFMYGGNDSHNWVYPFDAASYQTYASARGGVFHATNNPSGLALGVGSSAMGASRITDGRQFTMASTLAPLRALYDAGQLAVLPNVGPLIRPVTKTQYQSGGADLPPKLFSHNDQASIWQANAPEGARYGWAGRMGDLLQSANAAPVFTSISATGNTVLLAGQSVVQYQVSTSGSVTMSGTKSNPLNSTTGAAQVLAALQDTGVTALQAEYARVIRRSIDTDVTFKAQVLDLDKVNGVEKKPFDTRLATPATAYINPGAGPVSLDKDSLAQQLRMVAQIIAKNTDIGAKRQVFMVSMGGFDTHDDHARDQPALMQRVAHSIKYFQDAITALGLANNVALFTASDFGRTLSSNGKGSDHGWGATHFIAGGSGQATASPSTGNVKGGNIFGTPEPAGLGHNSEVGQGRLLPTTSVDQYAATLGKWFGLSDTDLDLVLPNLRNFGARDLGFML